ncbi:MAG: pyridinium-3,5-biscarboxylic acid mononucleotide synthase [Archaeoglobi archaeon]|nr:nickel pincer cofactor biosynthesis protein LarB [Candidatus Mnemosynella bozhongmuii]MDK2781538.1 pyridinium-3,5-biscarboxylic acid mononucleotide synthase [Archaeoglobi archaeon]
MRLREILEKVRSGEMSIEEAEEEIRFFRASEVEGIARIDLGRELRKGVPEVIFGEVKRDEEILKIARKMLEESGRCIITRLTEERAGKITEALPEDIIHEFDSGVLVLKKRGFELRKSGGKVAILTAGTSDIPVAKEAEVIAREMGCDVMSFHDVGVAGIHRLFPALREILEKDCDVIIVVAGMDGALPSVVSGIVDIPVIGVPTSTGYGAGGKGVAALYSMLQSCSPGLGVVNIDNGFGAGVLAAIIANRVARFRARNG